MILNPPPPLPADAALFLDFDGTLVDLAPRPDLVRVDGGLSALMAGLTRRLGGRVAVVSGRPAGEVRSLFGAPGFAVSGSHGAELHHPDGRVVAAERPAALDTVRVALAAFAARDSALVLEDKPLGVALHFRLAPQHEVEATALARDLARHHALRFQPGKLMAEVRGGAGDKGTALAALMREPEMASARPVFVGDDATDEPAFAAATEHGGWGVLVGEPRPTAATYRLPGVAATLDWLEGALA